MAAEKEPMGKVKLRVRESALTMKEFTLEEMVRATGLNKDSVESELKRMRERGFITVHNTKRPKPGRPPCLYKLTSDPEKRFKLSTQVAEFYPKPRAQERPTSHHYFRAVELLDSLGEKEKAEDRARVLSECEDELSFAWYEEGSPDGVLEAFIQSQKGRVEYLKENYEQAQALFEKAMETFTIYNMPEEKAWVGEHSLASRVQRKWKAEPSSSLLDRALFIIADLYDLGTSLSTQHPMLVLLLGMAEQLVSAQQPARAMVLEHANSTVSSAAENTLLKAVVRANGSVTFWEGEEALAGGQGGGTSRRQRADILPISSWEHTMSDPYKYEQPSEPGGPWIGLNSPVRKNSSASIAAAAGPNLSDGLWRYTNTHG